MIEKHLTLSRAEGGPDSEFSLEPHEFKEVVDAIRTSEKAMGEVIYEITEKQKASHVFRRSLFVVKDIKKGGFTNDNVRSIRPRHGLHTRYMKEILGRHTSKDIKRGMPLTWDMLGR